MRRPGDATICTTIEAACGRAAAALAAGRGAPAAAPLAVGGAREAAQATAAAGCRSLSSPKGRSRPVVTPA